MTILFDAIPLTFHWFYSIFTNAHEGVVWKLKKLSRIPSERVNSDFRRGVSESAISSKQHEVTTS